MVPLHSCHLCTFCKLTHCKLMLYLIKRERECWSGGAQIGGIGGIGDQGREGWCPMDASASGTDKAAAEQQWQWQWQSQWQSG